LPFGPVSTDPTCASVVDPTVSDFAETPELACAEFVVVGELCEEPHAAIRTAIAARAATGRTYRKRPFRRGPVGRLMVRAQAFVIAFTTHAPSHSFTWARALSHQPASRALSGGTSSRQRVGEPVTVPPALSRIAPPLVYPRRAGPGVRAWIRSRNQSRSEKLRRNRL